MPNLWRADPCITRLLHASYITRQTISAAYVTLLKYPQKMILHVKNSFAPLPFIHSLSIYLSKPMYILDIYLNSKEKRSEDTTHD
jgi:hypothetical protein